MKPTAVVQPYREALERFQRDAGDLAFARRASELLALLEVTTTLNAGGSREETLNAVLRIVARELNVARGALFVRNEAGDLALVASCGLPADAPPTLADARPFDEFTAAGPGDDAHDRDGLVLLCPIRRRDRPIGVLGLGRRDGDAAYGEEERAFLRCVVACVGAPIQNGLVYEELGRVSQQRSRDVVRLRNLLDISRELNRRGAEESIHDLILTSVMGHFVVSRCALYVSGPPGLTLAAARGLPFEDRVPIPVEEAFLPLESAEPKSVAELPEGPLRTRLSAARHALAVPLVAGTRLEGILAIGERASGTEFSAEDRSFAQALARQAQAALENARLQKIREQKQRQDRELQMAREIQQSLLPPRTPEVPGFEVAAASRACYEVGGDSYDWIDLGSPRLALVIADVSGKGTPASLLMASVQASVRALAGTAAPVAMIERLNHLVFASTQPSRYVTLCYAELDARSRRLTYVNAGHIPPFLVGSDGGVTRLETGGAAVGLLDESTYEAGEVVLEPGSLLAMVTDGATEATSADDVELGDERICEVLRRLAAESATAVLNGLIAAVDEWAGGTKLGDDLTALIVRARAGAPARSSRSDRRRRKTTREARRSSARDRKRGDGRPG